MFAIILSQIIAYNYKKCVLLGDVELYGSSKSRLGNLNVYSKHNLRHTKQNNDESYEWGGLN